MAASQVRNRTGWARAGASTDQGADGESQNRATDTEIQALLPTISRAGADEGVAVAVRVGVRVGVAVGVAVRVEVVWLGEGVALELGVDGVGDGGAPPWLLPQPAASRRVSARDGTTMGLTTPASVRYGVTAQGR